MLIMHCCDEYGTKIWPLTVSLWPATSKYWQKYFPLILVLSDATNIRNLKWLWNIFMLVQRDETQSRLFIILQIHCTCYGCQPHPSSGVHKTVTTASGTGHIFCAATSFQHGHVTVTVLWTPDDGCGWHPKHVEWTCRIINRLLCVASRWTVIDIHR